MHLAFGNCIESLPYRFLLKQRIEVFMSVSNVLQVYRIEKGYSRFYYRIARLTLVPDFIIYAMDDVVLVPDDVTDMMAQALSILKLREWPAGQSLYQLDYHGKPYVLRVHLFWWGDSYPDSFMQEFLYGDDVQLRQRG